MDSVMTGGFKGVFRSLMCSLALLLVSGSLCAALADVSRIGAWAQPINNDTASPYTGTVTAGASASGLRALVVTVGLDYTTQPGSNPVITANYGGQAMTQAALACAGTGSRCAGVYYLLESGIVAAGANTTLTLTTSVSTGTPNFVAYAATFDNVSQTHPIADFAISNRSTAGTTLTFGKNVAVGTGDMALYALDVDVITSTHTPPANYTNQLSDTTTGHSAFVAQRSVPTSDASENLTVTFTNAIASLAVAVLNDVSFNALTSCSGCHDYPPADGSARNTPEGAVIGDHGQHNFACSVCHVAPATTTSSDFAHRDGEIKMATPIFGGSGSYSRIAPISQSNNPTTGTCSNVSCHNGAITPQWGVGTTTCSSCHALPPNTDAHTKHYTAKGWSTGVTTNCTVCHPDNSVAHSNVTDGVITVNGSLTPGGTSPAITCSATPTGCHNGLATPAWNTTAIACTACHTVGGGGANPNTGLHNITVAGPQHHDDGITGGCTACHNATKPATHANGTFTADSAADTDRFISRTNMTWADGAANSGTCSGTGLSGCHSDSGNWTRLWSTDANSTVTTAGDARCNVCHGQFGNWRVGTSHYNTNGGAASTRGQSHNSLTGPSNACEDCHSYPTLIANHENNQVTMNDGGATTVTVSGNSVWCAKCHSNDGLPSAAGTHTFDTSVFTLQTVTGGNDPVGDCSGCHGGGTVGANSENFWPDNSTAHASNQPGRHVKHMTVIARRLYNEDLTTLLADNGNGTSAAKQKAICEYCHAATTNDGDHTNSYPADVFDTTLGKKAKHLSGAADADATYAPAADTCSNVDCHNTQLTTDGTYGWYDASTSACTMCHTVGAGNNPNSGLHTTTAPTVSGAAGQHDDTFGTGGTCTTCHSALPSLSTTQSNTHVNGTFTGDTVANLGFNTAISYVQSAANVGTCFGSGNGTLSTCHNGAGDMGTWKRVWNSAVNNDPTGDGDTVECAGCHGGFNSDWTFGSVANTTDGSVEHARDWQGADGAEVIGNHSNNTSDAVKCNTCHVYGDPQYVLGTHHRDGNITMNSVPVYTGTSWNCTNVCHADNTGHNLEDSGWTTATLAGPPMTCTTCHGGGAPAGKVSATSSHVDADGAGATFTSGNCVDCHIAHADGTSGSNDVEISTVYTGTSAVPTMTKADGTTALYSTHSYKIRLGGNATVGKTVSGLSITFTAPNLIGGTGIGSGTFPAAFRVGDIIQVKGSTSNGTDAAPKYFTITVVAANQLTVAESITAEAASATEVISSCATEAQLCWNCHTGIGGAGTFGVTEWGSNQQTNTGDLTYDYGYLFTDVSTIPGTKTANWTAGYWRSGKGLNSTLTTNPFWYKRGAVRSTHSANYDATTAANDTGKVWQGTLKNTASGYSTTYNKGENLDLVANIRCSYCHDVHGTHDTIKGDVAGLPYLRGTWKGNLYPEDGAPRYGMANWTTQTGGTTVFNYAYVPRASASSTNSGLSGVNNAGGYWIDQNSGNPTSTITGATALDKATNSSGLCEQCHGVNKNGTWTAAAIGAIDQITGEGLWVSTGNGHANAVIGAPGVASTTANIFNRTRRGVGTVQLNQQVNQWQVDMGLQNMTSGYGLSYRSASGGTSGYGWIPRVAQTAEANTTGARAYAYEYFAWNTTLNGNTGRTSQYAAGTMSLDVSNPTPVASETAHNSQSNYHTFTCSKCHNPHASRLPKLMITNCLDTNHNTWEDKNTFIQGQAIPAGNFAGLRHSQWASAQNCHRLDARATNAGTTTVGTGWTTVTPWIEDTAPNPASGSGKTVDITTQIAY